MSVYQRFNKFLANLQLTENQVDDGARKRGSVVSVLNKTYWNTNHSTSHSIYVGSWAKRTRIRPPRDVDVLFRLPWAVHTRFDNRAGNKQSQLLQEVKNHLSTTFVGTKIRGDGPVVLVSFLSFNVELIPAFEFLDGTYYVCMTDAGGRYKTADYTSESNAISASDNTTNGNTRHLVRMMKKWQDHCYVPLKSFHIELTAISFLNLWGNAGHSATYYDWMVRDYLAYLITKQNSWVYAPGTNEPLYLGSNWVSRAETALARAKKACELEAKDLPITAGEEWQKIFGTDIPKYL